MSTHRKVSLTPSGQVWEAQWGEEGCVEPDQPDKEQSRPYGKLPVTRELQLGQCRAAPRELAP